SYLPACPYWHPVGPGIHPESTAIVSTLIVSPFNVPVTFTLCPACSATFVWSSSLYTLSPSLNKTAGEPPRMHLRAQASFPFIAGFDAHDSSITYPLKSAP